MGVLNLVVGYLTYVEGGRGWRNSVKWSLQNRSVLWRETERSERVSVE